MKTLIRFLLVPLAISIPLHPVDLVAQGCVAGCTTEVKVTVSFHQEHAEKATFSLQGESVENAGQVEVTFNPMGGDDVSGTVSLTAKSSSPVCPVPLGVIKVPCGIEVAVVGHPDFSSTIYNRDTIKIPMVEPLPDETQNYTIKARVVPLKKQPGGSDSPQSDSSSAGGGGGGGGKPLSLRVFESISGGLAVEVVPHSVKSHIPLGYGSDSGGGLVVIGGVSLNYPMGASSLGIVNFTVSSSRFDPLNPMNVAKDVRWVSTSGSPRILLSPEAAVRFTELTESHLTDTSRGVKVEVFARADFNATTSLIDGGALPVSTYLYDRIVGGLGLTVSEWIGVAATEDPTKVTGYALSGVVFSETSGGIRKETVISENLSSSDPNDDVEVRAAFKRVTTGIYDIIQDPEILTAMTVEDYGFIPRKEIDGATFGPIIGIKEVLKSRRMDLDGDGDPDAGEPTETWYYYGEETGTHALTVPDYHLFGMEKLHVGATGGWRLTGHYKIGDTRRTLVFSPWTDTAPPDPSSTGAFTDYPGTLYPVKKVEMDWLYAIDTTTLVTRTYHLAGSGSGQEKLIGEEEVNSSDALEEGDDGTVTTDGLRMTRRMEFTGKWTPGSGNALTEFNAADSQKTHRMVVTTHGTSHGYAFRYFGTMGVVPGASTQEIEITGGDGVVLRETRVLPPGLTSIGEEDPENPPDPENPQDPINADSSFVPATRETYIYDAEGRRTEVKKDGRTVASTHYLSPRVTLTVDEQGIATETEIDANGREIRSTVEAGGGVPAINRTTEYAGLTVTSLTNGVVTASETRDRAGRVVSRSDQTGAVIDYTYSTDGRVVTETHPGGLTVVTENHRSGRTKEITGTAVVGRYYDYAIEADGTTGKAFQLETERIGASNSPRLRTMVIHWEGGHVKEVRTPNAATTDGTPYVVATPDNSLADGFSYQPVGVSGYGGTGSAGGASYPANTAAGAMGMHSISGKVQGWSGSTPTGQTRLAHIQRSYIEHEGKWWLKTLQTRGLEETHATRQQYTMTRLWQGDGRKSITWSDGEEITVTTTFDRGAKAVTQATASNRGSIPEITHSVNGFVQWQQGKHSADVARRATFGYDSLGRMNFAKDHRGGVTRTTYNAAGQVEKTLDTLNRATTYAYIAPNQKNAGRVDTITKADGETTVHTYTDRGEIASIGGTSEYPQEFTYNAFGDRHSLKTTRANGSGTRNVYTLWTYNAAGQVLAKYYGQTSTSVPGTAPNGTVSHVYDPFGRVLSKVVKAGRTTANTYNIFGELLTINYGNDGGGADVTLTRDNAGLVSQAAESYENAAGTIAMGSGTTSYSYTAGSLDSVTYSSGHTYLPNVKLDYKTRDAEGRPTGYEVFDGATERLDVGYGYDTAGRVSSVSSLHGTFTYGYHPGSGIVSGYTGDSGGTVIEQIRPVDFQNRISSVTTKNGSGQILASVAYSHDAVDRRTQARREDGSYWNYGYNDRGEVTAAQRYSVDDAAINGLERQYEYDPIGNRKWAKFGGGASGALSQITYTPNDFNQYTAVATPGKAWVTGRAPSGDPVEVNTVAAGRQDTWFSRELTVSNSGGPVKQAVTVKDGASTTIASGNLSVPKASVSQTYDQAGNLANDGRWVYEWDSENRLRKMTATSAATTAGFPNQVVDFVYDWQGRRIAKKVTEGSTVRHTRYLYDEWNVVAEWTLHGSSTTLLTPQTYLWGLDLAGQNGGDIHQLQGAGGVGGLLAADLRKVSDASGLGQLYASYDGNGNILAWSGTDGLVKRSQDYDAFGNVVLKNTDDSGPLGSAQGEVGYGFSTKPEEKESGLLYYGYRYYHPVGAGWLSRDPIEEQGGINLYGFVSNDAVNSVDVLGRNPVVVVEVCAGGAGVSATAAAVAAAYGLSVFECKLDPSCRRALLLVENPTAVLTVVGNAAICHCADMVYRFVKSKKCKKIRQYSGPAVMSGATMCTYECDGVEKYMTLRGGDCPDEVDEDDPNLYE